MVDKIVTATVELLQRKSYPHWRRDVIRFADLDPIGHVNNVAYVSFFESGRVTFFRDLGRAVDDPAFAWMAVHIEIDYREQLTLPGEVDIGTGVLEIGNRSVRLAHAVFSGDVCVAQGQCVMVMVDRLSQRASPFPDVLRRSFVALRCGG